MFFICCVPTIKGGMRASKYTGRVVQASNQELGAYYKTDEQETAEELACIISKENPSCNVFVTRAMKVMETPPGKLRIKDITLEGEKLPA